MIDLISVSCKSKGLLEKNYQLVKRLNPDTPFRWNVVQNSPDGVEDITSDDPRFELIEGIKLSQKEQDSIAFGSIAHGKALNKAVEKIDSNLILTLDPDCFVLVPGWIDKMIKHAQRNKLAFFGAPYPPRELHYFRFPTVICCLIQRSLLGDEKLDFQPDTDYRRHIKSVWKEMQYSSKTLRQALRPRPSMLTWKDRPALLRYWLNRRCAHFQKNSYHDTGYHNYRSFSRSVNYDCLQIHARDFRGWRSRLVDSFLPDRLRVFPRDRSWIRETPSKDFEELGDRCEQYFWGGELFAVHLHLSQFTEEKKLELFSRLDKLIPNLYSFQFKDTHSDGVVA